MADAYRGLTIEFNGDTTKLSKALSQVNRETRQTGAYLAQVNRGLKFNPRDTTLLAQQQKYLGTTIGLTAEKLKTLKAADEQYASASKTLTADDVAGWEKVQREIITTESTLKHYKKQLTDSMISQGAAESLLGKFGGAVERFGTKVEGVGRGMQTIGRGLSRTITPAILGTGAATVAAAVNIDTGLTNVRKTVDGTEEQFQQLKASAIDFSKTNAVSARQILDIQALGAQLGFSIDELDEFGRVVSGLDIATNMDAETAATQLAQFANITKMSHGEISNYGSAIVGLGNNFATTESDISAMAMRIAASGTQVHMSQADILGLATALSSMGVEADAGGSAVSTIMANIDKAVATNSDKVATWASAANMSVDEFSAAWKSKPVDALSAVLSGMESATDEGGNMSVMLQDLGIDSIRQTDVMKRLAGNSELVGRAVAKSNEEWQKNTALQNEVDNRNESLAAKFEMVKNKAIAVADQVGGPLADALLGALDAASPLFDAIASGAQAFSDMDEDQQRLILTLVGVAAAFGPVMNVVGGAVTHIKDLGTGLQNAARFFSALDAKTSGATRQIKKMGEETGKAEKATKKHNETMKKSSVGMGVLKGAAVGLAMTGIALLIKYTVDCANKQKDFIKATDGVTGSMHSMDTAFLNARSSVGKAADGSQDYVKTLDEVSVEVEKAVKKQAELSDSISGIFSEAGTKIGMIEGYRDIISDLAGKSNLTSDEQGKLSLAIKGVNDEAGTNYQVVKDAGGAYVIMKDGVVQAKDAVLKLIDTQQLQWRLEAGQDAYKEQFKANAENANAAADATDRLADSEKNRDARIKEYTDNGFTQAAAEQMVAAEIRAAKGAADAANDTYAVSQVNTKKLTDENAFLSRALGETASSQSFFVATNDYLIAALNKSGKSASRFAGTLEGVGANTEELKNLSDEKLSALAKSYDGTYSSISGLLQSYGVEVDGAKVATEQAYEGIRGSWNLSMKVVQDALEKSGQSADGFARTFADMGVSTETFNALTADQLAQVAGSYDGTVASVQGKMWEFAAATEGPGADAAAKWKQGFSSESQSMIDAAASASGLTLSQFRLLADESGAKGEDAVAKLAKSISDQGGEAPAAAQKLIEAVALKMTGGDIGQASRIVGHDVGTGLAQGIDQGADDSKQKALDMANGVINQAKDALGVQSPSVVFHGIGLNLGQGLADGINEGADLAASAADGLSKLSSDHMSSSVTDAWFAGSSLVTSGYVPGLTSGQGDVAASSDMISKLSADHMSSASGDAWWAGRNMAGSSFSDGVGAGQSQAASASDYVSKLSADHMSSANGDAWWAGRNMAAGMAQGIRSGSYEVVSAAEVMSSNAVMAAKRALDEHSPSRVAKGIGKFFSQGLAEGIEEDGRLAIEASESVALASARAASVPQLAMRLSRSSGFSVARAGDGASHAPRSMTNNDNRTSEVTINVSVQGGSETDARQIARELYALETRAKRSYR